MRVLVTDGENRAALAVTRALGRLGHAVLVGDWRAASLAQASRHCSARVQYPDPARDPDAFVDGLALAIRDHRVDVLIPVSDITTFLVTGHRDRFPCAVPCAPAAVVERAADKVDILQTAARIGVPVPRSAVVHRPEALPSLDGLDFPLVIKPWRSRIRTPQGWMATAVSYAATPDDLTRNLRDRPDYEFPVLLQERIVGPGAGVFVCQHEGQTVAIFSHRRLRERPPWGGVSVLSESVPVNPAAACHATRLLQEIGWQGVAMVEFKLDARDGQPKLMEINGRFWGSLQLAIDAGVNFPELLVRTVSGSAFQPQPPYRTGVRTRWLWGDVDSLLVTLFRGKGSPPLPRWSRARALFEFLKFFARDLHYDNPKWDDQAPFLTETREWCRTLAGGFGRPQRAAAMMPANRRTVSGEDTPIRVSVANSFEAAGLSEAAWNRLAGSGGTHTIFQTWQWARAWWETYGDQHELVLVTAADDAGLRAVAPFTVERTPRQKRVIRFLGHGRADYCDVLAAAGDTAAVDAIFTALLDAGGWDRMELNGIPAGSATVSLLPVCCSRAAAPILRLDDVACPTLCVEGREADARAILHKYSLRRRLNYFARSGTLAVRHLTRADEINPWLEVFFDQHVARWSRTNSPSLFRHSRNREFYRRLTHQMDETSWLLFTVVEHDGRPIAFHYGFDFDGAVTWYKPSFDPAQASHSPGLVLLRHLIEYTIEQGRRELDFALGDEPFKARFTNEVRACARLRVFRHPVAFQLARAGRQLRTAVRWAARS